MARLSDSIAGTHLDNPCRSDASPTLRLERSVRPRRWRTGFALIIATLLSPVLGPALANSSLPIPAPPSPQLAAFTHQPNHLSAVAAAATKAFSNFWACPVANAGPAIRISTFPSLGPVKFDENANLTAGVIAERLPVSGCGAIHLQNVLTIASNGKLNIVPSVPGTTIADPLLLHDSLPVVYGGAARRVGACRQVKFVDTAFDGFEGPANPRAKNQSNQGRPWRESWTLNACGAILPLTVHYVPDASGTSINVGPM